jgi:starvation-inducible DNA-binding protein
MPKTSAHKLYKIPNSDTAIFHSSINIEESKRNQLIEILNARLADVLDLQSQAKFAHWNVKGKDFYQLHLLFDEVAEHLEEAIDLIAERATALGGRAQGTVRQAAKGSSIPEYDHDIADGMQHVGALSERLAAFANNCRDAIDETDGLGDKGTADLFTEIVRQADKDLYFLESHIQH